MGKLIVCCDNYIYQKLFMEFPIVNENGEAIGSEFDADQYDNYVISEPSLLGNLINPLIGLKDISLVMIQKSHLTDLSCINFSKYLKRLHPDAKLIFYMDRGVSPHPYFCHRIVTENLGVLVENIEQLDQALVSQLNVDQSHLCLPKLSKRQKKKFESEMVHLR